jgi:hypothetical protein
LAIGSARSRRLNIDWAEEAAAVVTAIATSAGGIGALLLYLFTARQRPIIETEPRRDSHPGWYGLRLVVRNPGRASIEVAGLRVRRPRRGGLVDLRRVTRGGQWIAGAPVLDWSAALAHRAIPLAGPIEPGGERVFELLLYLPAAAGRASLALAWQSRAATRRRRSMVRLRLPPAAAGTN